MAVRQDKVNLGEYQPLVDEAIAEIAEKEILSRVWAHDHTVWKPEPTEIGNRLGWLHCPQVMAEAIPRIQKFAESVRAEGYNFALLLGMGGSSLAPEVFRKTFGVSPGYLDLAVLDSTDPGAVLAYAEKIDPARTLFIVSTKSGGTVETFSFFKFFYNHILDALGKERAGQHFIAITDPGSALADIAAERNFRATFLNDPNIGGRYSALSHFGLVPAALLGVEVGKLLDRAAAMACNGEGCNAPARRNNAGAWLGAIIGKLALAGRDKLTLITSPSLSLFGAWVEQLIAESLGKEGKGVLPVVGEAIGPPEVYGDDRLFIYLRLEGEDSLDSAAQRLVDAGQPFVQFDLKDPYDLGGEFFRWEMATAVAGHLLGVNPFDQPNVEAAKALARKMMEAYRKGGALPEPAPALRADGIAVYSNLRAESLAGALNFFLALARPGDYIALQAYLRPTDETTAALEKLRLRLRDRLRLAVTLGYGPRFLHSTGQLHKGDAGNGLFIQLTADDRQDLPIPDEIGSKNACLAFGIVKAAQALGDHQVLLDIGQRAMRFHFSEDVIGGIQRLVRMFGAGCPGRRQ